MAQGARRQSRDGYSLRFSIRRGNSHGETSEDNGRVGDGGRVDPNDVRARCEGRLAIARPLKGRRG